MHPSDNCQIAEIFFYLLADILPALACYRLHSLKFFGKLSLYDSAYKYGFLSVYNLRSAHQHRQFFSRGAASCILIKVCMYIILHIYSQSVVGRPHLSDVGRKGCSVGFNISLHIFSSLCIHCYVG